jgi:uncharacterized membrane protein YphA (DoxX/SURF4 family)
MALVRTLARSMLAATFVVQGAKVIKNPDPLVPSAKPVTDQVVPTLRRVAPPQLAQRIPEDPRLWVRVNAAVHVAGGLALATGRCRRIGALALAASMIPTTVAGHPFWEEDDPARRANQQIHFLKNLGLLGGLLLAALDTEGRPAWWWRARHGAKDAAQVSRLLGGKARREARLAARAARREARLQARIAALQAREAARTRRAHRRSRRGTKSTNVASAAVAKVQPALSKVTAR